MFRVTWNIFFIITSERGREGLDKQGDIITYSASDGHGALGRSSKRAAYSCRNLNYFATSLRVA